jgi:type III pantothenate kinase
MIVCLDSGNTRIKWGVHDGTAWLAQGVAQAEVSSLAELVERWPQPDRVMLANVAGDETGRRIRQHLAAWQPLFEEVRSGHAAAG